MVLSALSIGSRGNQEPRWTAAVNKSGSGATNGEQHGGAVGSEKFLYVAANDHSLGGSGLDGAIHAAAGAAFLAEANGGVQALEWLRHGRGGNYTRV